MSSNKVEKADIISAIIQCDQNALDALRASNEEDANIFLHECFRDILNKHIVITRETLTFLNDNLIACGRRKAFPVECLDVKDWTNKHEKLLIAYTVHLMQEIEDHQGETDMLFLHNVDMVLRLINKLQFTIKGLPWNKVIFLLHRYINYYQLDLQLPSGRFANAINGLYFTVITQTKLKQIIKDFRNVFDMLLNSVKHKDIKSTFIKQSLDNLEHHYWETRDIYTLHLMQESFYRANDYIQKSNEIEQLLNIFKLIQELGELFKQTDSTPNMSTKLRAEFEKFIPHQIFEDIIELRNRISHAEYTPDRIQPELLQSVIGFIRSLFDILMYIYSLTKKERYSYIHSNLKSNENNRFEIPDEYNDNEQHNKCAKRNKSFFENLLCNDEYSAHIDVCRVADTNCFKELIKCVKRATFTNQYRIRQTIWSNGERFIDNPPKILFYMNHFKSLNKLLQDDVLPVEKKLRNDFAHINNEKEIEMKSEVDILIQQMRKPGRRRYGIQSISVVQEEIQHHLDSMCSWNQTGLHIAIIDNDTKEIIKQTKEDFCDDATDAAGNNAITYAIRCNNLRLMDALPHTSNLAKCLLDACQFDSLDILNYFLEHKDSSYTSHQINAALMMAAKNHYIRCIDALLKHMHEKICIIPTGDNDEKANETILLRAAEYNYTEHLTTLLQHGVNVNATDSTGSTPLHYAANCGHQSTMEILLRYNADIKAKSNMKMTALHCAAIRNNVQVLQMLLEHGAEVDAKWQDGETVLTSACGHANDQVVKILIEYGANINAPCLPLRKACMCGHVGVVEILLKHGALINDSLHYASAAGQVSTAAMLLAHGADINAVIKGGITALHCAVIVGHTDVINLLLKHSADIFARISVGYDSLLIATIEERYDVVRFLLDRLFLIHTTTNRGNSLRLENCSPMKSQNTNDWSELMYACASGDVNTVKRLWHDTSDVYIDEAIGHLPLILACAGKHVEVVTALLQNGVDVNRRTTAGFGALRIATLEGHLEIVQLLVSHKANVNACDKSGRTALHFACDEKIAKILLDTGATMNISCSSGRKPLHYACLGGHEKKVKLLLDSGDDINSKSSIELQSPLHYAASNGHCKIVKYLLINKAKIEDTDQNGATALHCAVENNHIATIEILLKNCDNVNAKAIYGCTALHLAALKGYAEVIDLLLSYKADVNAQSINHGDDSTGGVTPIHLACSSGHERIVKILISHGGNINVQNSKGDTPLHHAVTKNHYAVVSLLLDKGTDMSIKNNDNNTALRLAKNLNHLRIFKLMCNHIILTQDKIWRLLSDV